MGSSIMGAYERTWLAWLSRARILAITCVLGIEFTIVNFTPAVNVPMRLFVTVVVIWYTVAAFFMLLQRMWQEAALQARIQVLTDIVFTTLLVYVAGGVDASFNFLYALIIIVASIMLPAYWAYLTAATAFICFGTVLELSFFGAIRSFTASSPDLRSIQIVIAVNLVAFLAVAYLGSRLSARLRAMRSQYERQQTDLDALRILHGTIVQSISGGLITTDLNGVITLVNPAAERLLERGRSECVSRELGVLLGAQPAELAMGPRQELRYTSPSGVEKIFGLSASPLVGDSGFAGHVYSFNDLTEIRRLENEVRKQDQLAAVGRMAAGIAHEIRNPLTSIGGSAMMLRETATLDDEQAMLMDIVIRESERLNNIVTDFLTYARERESHFEPVDLVPLLEDTVCLLRSREEVQAGFVAVKTDFAVEQAWTVADGDRLKQVLWNICHNALRAMTELDKDKTKAHVLGVRLTQTAGEWQIGIRDNGPGMRPQQLEKMFEPFQSEFSGGTGLGLAIVYRIVQQHEGKISVQSQLGKGTELIVSLKRMTSQATFAAAAGEVTRG
jgi:two-component system, NtrC family, sensor histidine kinase PilS